MQTSFVKFHKWFISGLPALSKWILKHRECDLGTQKVTFRGGNFDDLISIIQSGVKPIDGVEPDLLHSSVRAALFDTTLSMPLEQVDLAKHIAGKIGGSRGEETKFVLLSGMYLEGSLPFGKIKMPDALVSFYPEISFKSKSLARFISEQDKEISKIGENPQFSSKTPRQIPKGITLVKVFVTARSSREAANKALSSFDQFLGLLNYSVNAFRISGRSYGNLDAERNRVFNHVTSLRFHSVHELNGKFIPNSLYYVRQHGIPKKALNVNLRKNEKVIDLFNKSFGKLKSKHDLADVAWESLKLYSRALELPGYHHAFLRLWAVIEDLCGIKPSESHDRIVSRSAFLYGDPERVKLLLHHLRVTRNDLIHAHSEISSSSEEIAIYQLNRFVCQLLTEYIINYKNFGSKDEFILFLDNPLNAKVLKKKLDALEKAYDYRKDL